MDLNSTIDIIIKDLEEAGRIIDDLKRYEGVPELQVELAKSKCKGSAELIALLKHLTPSLSGNAVKEEKKAETILPVPEPIHVIKPVLEQVRVEVVKPAAEPMAEKKEEQAKVTRKAVEGSILADQFTGGPESFNETLGSLKHDGDMLEVLKIKPLLSLDEAIGLNDKFLFIREIFDGNSESYNKAINKLESVGNFSDALAVLMSYTSETSENEAVKQLIDLIKRKFPSNE